MSGRVPTLVGLWEIAAMANRGPSAVANWRNRFSDFPEPTEELRMGPVFVKTDIEAFFRDHPNLMAPPKRVSPETRDAVRAAIKNARKPNVSATAKEFGLTRQTVYRLVEDLLFGG